MSDLVTRLREAADELGEYAPAEWLEAATELAASRAVIDAAIRETNAEAHLTNALTAALTAKTGHGNTALARHAVRQARHERRDAVRAYNEARR